METMQLVSPSQAFIHSGTEIMSSEYSYVILENLGNAHEFSEYHLMTTVIL